MKSMESKLADVVDPKDFWDDCQVLFASQEGRRVMEVLLKMAHPLYSPLRETPEETHVAIGRAEVVALLSRRAVSAFEGAPTNQ